MSKKYNSSFKDDVETQSAGGSDYNYARLTGTSQAAPFAAGTAVLLWSRYPGKSASEIKQAILKGANAYYASDYTKYGFLDAK